MSIKVLITGSNGFLGKNLIARLKNREDVTVYPYDIEDTKQELIRAVNRCDFIFHLAGINRSEKKEDFVSGNVGLTQQILQYIEEAQHPIPIAITSSTQAGNGTIYGTTKQDMETLVKQWAKEGNRPVYIYRLTNIFGKWCRPNYNSVVATFCYNISHGLPIQVDDPDKKLYLSYVDDVMNSFINLLDNYKKIQPGERKDIPERVVRLSEIVHYIKTFSTIKESLLIGNMGNRFIKQLYATYLSYLEMDDCLYPLSKKEDDRGWLAEVIKSKEAGQIFLSKTKPGITRGNHWHHTKVEKFLVISGKARIILRSILGEEVIEYLVSGESLQIVDIPPGYTHAIKNIGREELVTLFWANEIFDPKESDTYYEEVED